MTGTASSPRSARHWHRNPPPWHLPGSRLRSPADPFDRSQRAQQGAHPARPDGAPPPPTRHSVSWPAPARSGSPAGHAPSLPHRRLPGPTQLRFQPDEAVADIRGPPIGTHERPAHFPQHGALGRLLCRRPDRRTTLIALQPRFYLALSKSRCSQQRWGHPGPHSPGWQQDRCGRKAVPPVWLVRHSRTPASVPNCGSRLSSPTKSIPRDPQHVSRRPWVHTSTSTTRDVICSGSSGRYFKLAKS